MSCTNQERTWIWIRLFFFIIFFSGRFLVEVFTIVSYFIIFQGLSSERLIMPYHYLNKNNSLNWKTWLLEIMFLYWEQPFMTQLFNISYCTTWMLADAEPCFRIRWYERHIQCFCRIIWSTRIIESYSVVWSLIFAASWRPVDYINLRNISIVLNYSIIDIYFMTFFRKHIV